MPLVFIAIIVLASIVFFTQSQKDKTAQDAESASNLRKTNASLEKHIMDGYIQKGLSLDEAFLLTQKEIVNLGFEPCIPRSAYVGQLNGETQFASHITSCEHFDSNQVKNMREQFETISKLTKQNESLTEEEYIQKRDEYVYNNFPKTQFQADLLSANHIGNMLTVPVGEYLVYPKLGTCEVLGYCKTDPLKSTTYALKVLKDGTINTNISIADPKITRVR